MRHPHRFSAAPRDARDRFHAGFGRSWPHASDVAAHHAVACFHALNGRKRKAGHVGQGALVDAQKGAGCAHLRGRDDGLSLGAVVILPSQNCIYALKAQ